MKPWVWLLFVGWIGASIALCRPGTSTSRASPATDSTAATQYLGPGSCSASACHNANFAHGQARTEYAFWITRDPHARAYELLFDARARSIQKNLQRTAAPYEDPRCLSCHVAPGYVESKPPSQAPHLKRDGVSCESCHGPASRWINEHHLDVWQSYSTKDKQRLGMNDTRSLAGRAQVCAKCHVGAPGMDVTHDLIAAGHPRMHFEFAAFHAHLPRHWPDAKDRAGIPDFEARLWAVGQLATAHAALELLADRAGNEARPWPEFAEFDCAACHHQLKAPSDRQKLGVGKRKAGALPWGPQAFSIATARQLLPDDMPLHDAFSALQSKINAGNLRRAVIAQDATAAARLLQPSLSLPTPSERVIRNLGDALLRPQEPSGDEATQWQLAVAALTARDRQQLEGLRDALGKLPIPQYDSEAVRKRLLNLRSP